VRRNAHAQHRRERRGDLDRTVAVRRHAAEVSLEAERRGEGNGQHRDEPTAIAMLPNARLGDEVRIAGERGARDCAETLVERNVRRIEARRDLGVRPPEERGRFPEPCAIEMDVRAACASGVAEGDEVVPVRQHAAELALRKFDEHGSERIGDRREVGHRHRSRRRTARDPAQSAEHRVGPRLVEFQMTERMEGDRRESAPVAGDA